MEGLQLGARVPLFVQGASIGFANSAHTRADKPRLFHGAHHVAAECADADVSMCSHL